MAQRGMGERITLPWFLIGRSTRKDPHHVFSRLMIITTHFLFHLQEFGLCRPPLSRRPAGIRGHLASREMSTAALLVMVLNTGEYLASSTRRS